MGVQDYRREISMVAAEMENGKEGGDEFPDKFILFTSQAKARFSVKHKNHFSMPVSSALTMCLHFPRALHIPQSPG